MIIGKKTLLATAIMGSIYSTLGTAVTFDDYCYVYGGSYGCGVENNTSEKVLDLAGYNFDNIEELSIEDGDMDESWTIKNLTINNGNLSADYIYESEYDADRANNKAPLVRLTIGIIDSVKSLNLDSWNIEIERPVHELIDLALDIRGYNHHFILNNSYIKANADSIFSLVDTIYENSFTTEIDTLFVNNSTIINTKQHTLYENNADPDNPRDYGDISTLATEPGAVLFLDDFESTIDNFDFDNDGWKLNFNFNNSYIASDTFARVHLGDDSESPHYYSFNFSNSEGKFANLISRFGKNFTSDKFIIDNIIVNLDNATLTSGIYSNANGGYRYDNTTLNLTGNSVFNYSGGCTENCGEYILKENGLIKQFKHMNNSYIHAINISNNSTLAFSSEGDFKTLHVDKMTSDGTANLVMNTDLSALQSDFLYLGEAEGRFNVMVNDHGGEPTEDSLLALISVEQGNGQFALNEGKGVDIGAYVYDLKKVNYVDGESVWFLKPQAQDVVNDVIEETGDNEDSEVVIKQPQTSPSTDAVLGMASATHFILSDELQNLRMRRGDVSSNNHGTGNVWGRILGGRLDVNSAADSSYKLNRSGMEFGSDKLFQLGDDKLMIGVTASLSDNKVKHARGGTSDIDSYGVGLYATYLTDSNVYVDGVVKYMYFNNSLNAVTTNGDAVSSDYKQYGLGTALELGYKYQQDQLFVEPYGRMSYSNVSGKSITLSNGMKAKLDDYKSLLGEVGVSVGMQFVPSDTVAVKPYVKVAVEHEFIKNNDVVINNVHQFKNDFSGSAGKYGVGVSVDLGKNTSLFGEVNYSKGRHIESPVRANIGVRISF